MFGYAGQLLRINLTKRLISKEPLIEEELKKYLGGRGYGSKILFEEVKKGINPLGPENKLIFLTGPITGLPIVGNSRYMVASKSPLTGIWGEGTSGGFFPAELKKAGYDLIIIEGIADKPSFIWINDEDIEIKSAENIWGLSTSETSQEIKTQLNDKNIKIASIGPAGEKMVNIACIVNDTVDVVGRCGLGAVMGSKRLKAIAIKGSKKNKIKDPKELKIISSKLWNKLKSVPFIERISKGGTSSTPILYHTTGALPTKNFNTNIFESAEKISLTEKYEIVSGTCYACPIACKKYIKLGDKLVKAPEYETSAAFGSFCFNDDYNTIIKANEMCNEYGVDTISAGSSIAFAMECFENSVLNIDETEGIRLSWGNSKAIIQLLEKIVNKEGIGELIGKGVKKASQEIGRGSEVYAMHVKGLEIPMHTVRNKKGVGLSYATAVKGAAHMECAFDQFFEVENGMPDLGIIKPISRFAIEGKPRIVKKSQDKLALRDSLIFCAFPFNTPLMTLTDCSELIFSITGWQISTDELLKIGERANNLCRSFSVREFISKKDDSLPERFSEPLMEGPIENIGQKITKKDMNEMLLEYYALRGWSKNGIPTYEKLVKLDLKFIADELKKYFNIF